MCTTFNQEVQQLRVVAFLIKKKQDSELRPRTSVFIFKLDFTTIITKRAWDKFFFFTNVK